MIAFAALVWQALARKHASRSFAFGLDRRPGILLTPHPVVLSMSRVNGPDESLETLFGVE